MAETFLDERPIDAGAPFVHGEDTPKPTPKAEEPSAMEKRVAALEVDAAAKDKRIAELSASEKYWAERANGRAAAPVVEEEEPEPVDDLADEKAEKLLDDLSAEGIKAIQKRGFVRAADVQRMIREEVSAAKNEVIQGGRFDAMLAEQFPELKDAKSELFQRTQVHFREMADIDPNAAKSRVALYSAAKLAKHQLETEAKEKAKVSQSEKEERRRERIESQAPERGRGREEDGGELETSPQAREVIKNLSRFGVTEEEFRKHAATGSNGGRRGR